jgi:hypothetical protein
MTIQERIDNKMILERHKNGEWREGTVDELIGDYPFLKKHINGINWWHKNDRVAILKSLKEEKAYQLYMFSQNHKYSIWVTPKSIGAGSSCRYCEPMEDWHRGHDLPDGDCNEETFVKILYSIMHDELIPYVMNVRNKDQNVGEEEKFSPGENTRKSKRKFEKEYIGTIEPRWNDSKVVIVNDSHIADNALAFIYGAIKKYGTDPKAVNDLKNYITYMSTKIGEE